MERVDATRFHYDSELRFGTFETFCDGDCHRPRIAQAGRLIASHCEAASRLNTAASRSDNRGRRCPWSNAPAPPTVSSQRASATSPAASRRRRSSSHAPRERASGTSTAASSSTSPAASPARTSATARRPSLRRSTSRSTATSTSASWSGRTSRTSISAAGSTSSGPADTETKSILAQLRRRGDRERRQDRARGDRPGRRRRLRPRLPRPHEPDDGDDGEARLQAGLRAAGDGRLPRRGAVSVPRHLDGGCAREPRPPLQAGRRSELGRLHRARAGAGRGRLHPDAAGVRAGAAPDLRRARDRVRRRRGAGRLRPHRHACGRSSSSASSRTCSSRGRRSAAASRWRR